MLVRRALLREHRELFGGYIFDGTCLFITKKLAQDVIELTSRRLDESLVKITVKYTNTIEMTDSQALQILNLIMRKSMEGLNLQLVGRNYFDAASKVRAPLTFFKNN